MSNYLEINIVDTNLVSTNNTFTVEVNDCDNNVYTLEGEYILSDFPLLVDVNNIPFSSICYGIKITENLTNTFCEYSIYTITPSQTPSLTPTETPTNTPSLTPTETPTNTPSLTPTETPTNTPSLTPTETPTNTPSLTPTETPTNTPTLSVTPTNTPTQTNTNTPTQTPTQTSTQTPTPTITPTKGYIPPSPSVTPTNTITPTNTATQTPTNTTTQTPTNTTTQTPTNTLTQTNTNTPTQTPSVTPTNTITPTNTATQTPTNTLTQTNTNTPTQTPTQTNTNTPTLTNTPTPSSTPPELSVEYNEFRYYRITGLNSDDTPSDTAIYINEIDFYSDLNQTGTIYPTENLTSNTSSENIVVSSGYYYESDLFDTFESYDAWKAFDGLQYGDSAWWTLQISDPTTNWIQIDFGSPLILNSIQIRFRNSSSNDEVEKLRVSASNEGTFNGEEVKLTDINILQSSSTSNATYNSNFVHPIPNSTENFLNKEIYVALLNDENIVNNTILPYSSTTQEDATINVDFLQLKSKDVDKTTFTLNKTIYDDIVRTKYDSFNLDLPSNLGEKRQYTMNIVNKDSNINVVSFKNQTKTSSVKSSKSIEYEVKDEFDNIMGRASFFDNRFVGLYKVDDVLTRITKINETDYVSEWFTLSADTDCGDLPYADIDFSGITGSTNVKLNSTLNEVYCINMAYEIPYNMFNAIVQDDLVESVQEYVELLNLYTNVIYNADFGNSINFILSDIIQYETEADNPYNFGDYGGSQYGFYYNFVKSYINTNYSDLNYDYLCQINNVMPFGTIRGLAGVWGMYTNISNISLQFGFEPYIEFIYANPYQSDLVVLCHEIGHGFGLEHLFQNNPLPFPYDGGVYYNTVVDECTPFTTGSFCSGADSCVTIMSYCHRENFIYGFHPDRKNDLINLLNIAGSNLICQGDPPPPPPSDSIDLHMLGLLWQGKNDFSKLYKTSELQNWLSWSGWTSNDVPNSKILTKTSTTSDSLTFDLSNTEFGDNNSQLFFIIPQDVFNNSNNCRKNVKIRNITTVTRYLYVRYCNSDEEIFTYVSPNETITFEQTISLSYLTINLNTTWFEIVDNGIPFKVFDTINITSNGQTNIFDNELQLKPLVIDHDGSTIPQGKYYIISSSNLSITNDDYTISLSNLNVHDITSNIQLCTPFEEVSYFDLINLGDGFNPIIPYFVVGEHYNVIFSDEPNIPELQNICFTSSIKPNSVNTGNLTNSNGFCVINKINDCNDSNCS